MTLESEFSLVGLIADKSGFTKSRSNYVYICHKCYALVPHAHRADHRRIMHMKTFREAVLEAYDDILQEKNKEAFEREIATPEQIRRTDKNYCVFCMTQDSPMWIKCCPDHVPEQGPISCCLSCYKKQHGHKFEPWNPDWFKPRCKVCQQFEDAFVHQDQED